MAESSPFGISSSPRGELNVCSIFKIDGSLSVIQLLCVSLCIDFLKIFEVKHTFHLYIPDQNDIFQLREISNVAQVKWVRSIFNFWDHILHDFDIVRGLKALSNDKRLYANLLKAVLQLALLECWIDIDEYQVCTGSRKL
jgi:hypothetical protein